MSHQSQIKAAKAPIVAYGKKNWDAVRSAITPACTYDEVATHRKIKGADEVIACWKGWAAALPDSKATFHKAEVSGDTVILELTWRGTQTGPLETPAGQIAATGKTIELRACQVTEIAHGKVKTMRQYFDMATILQQLGVGAPAARASAAAAG
jgi:steroid delta-isomerase-like uncharacterized protein